MVDAVTTERSPESKTESKLETAPEIGAPKAQAGAGAAERPGEKVPEVRRAGSLLGNYKAEVAELLGGGAARRRRKGISLPEGDAEEPQIKMTRPPRRGRGADKD